MKNSKMTRSELIAVLANKFAPIPADEIDAAVRSVIDRLGLSLENGERIEIRGFGGFSIRHHEPRIVRNPKTGEQFQLPARSVIHFKPGKELRDRANASEIAKQGLPLAASDLSRT
jgi:integration host factor subunit beta